MHYKHPPYLYSSVNNFEAQVPVIDISVSLQSKSVKFLAIVGHPEPSEGFRYLYSVPKEKKQRADTYDEKLAINGSYDELIKVSVNYTPPKKEKAKKPARKAVKKKK
jgi:hypothetical protein